MTPTATRVSVLGMVFSGGLCAVLLHLWLLMVHDQDVWARRSYENRWAFRSVPSQRGVLRDRYGRELARDEPTTQVSVFYLRFRLRHVVGAAVHAATLWADLQSGQQGAPYGYRDALLGPRHAVNALFDVRVGALRRGTLERSVARELSTYATTVLSGCSRLSRRQVYAALRLAAQGEPQRCIGDVLDAVVAGGRAELLRRFDERLQELHAFDEDLRREQLRRAARLGIDVRELRGLFDTLERLRASSLAQERVTWLEDGEWREGSLKEEVRAPFAQEVAFDIAAALRIDGDRHPGIEVAPSVARLGAAAAGTSLAVLLGGVQTWDRTIGEDESAPSVDGADPQPERDPVPAWFERYAARELPDEWLDDLVPDGMVPTDEGRVRLQSEARRRFERELLVGERRGVTGLEAAFDDELSGRLGLRFVEHDSKRREQLLWSHLRVESGNDVRASLDVDLQRVAEAAVTRAQVRIAGLFPDDRNRGLVKAAVAVIDALGGDVLAYAGAPVEDAAARNLPGVWWSGNGSIGSTVKPFVLVEQLDAESSGRPHTAIAEFVPCDERIRYGDRFLLCDERHGDRGRDPVRAVADSCNVFFYQAALGLGDVGVLRALQRFGLCAADSPGPFADHWQPTVVGLPVAFPRAEPWILPQRAIGYGVAASPAHIARAYAGIATGWLPQLGLRAGESRARVSLADVEPELEIVRMGLLRCVADGTGRRLATLRRLNVAGKTGTAEVGDVRKQNNAWFSGYLPGPGGDGAWLCLSAVVYWTPDKTHGGDAAGRLVDDLLAEVAGDPRLAARYLPAGVGR